MHHLNMSHAAKCAKTTTHCSFRKRIQKTNKSDEPGWDLLFDAQLCFLKLQTLNNKKNLAGSFFWYSIRVKSCTWIWADLHLCDIHHCIWICGCASSTWCALSSGSRHLPTRFSSWELWLDRSSQDRSQTGTGHTYSNTTTQGMYFLQLTFFFFSLTYYVMLSYLCSYFFVSADSVKLYFLHIWIVKYVNIV